MEDPLLQSWEIHNRVNLFVLDAVPSENMSDNPASGGRCVADQFGHIHNVRLMWLKYAMPEGLTSLQKIEKGTMEALSIRNGLESSGKVIGELVSQSASSGRVKGFKPTSTAFVCYLISHEAHHRSQAIIALKDNKHPLDRKTLFGMWEWGVR